MMLNVAEVTGSRERHLDLCMGLTYPIYAGCLTYLIGFEQFKYVAGHVGLEIVDVFVEAGVHHVLGHHRVAHH